MNLRQSNRPIFVSRYRFLNRLHVFSVNCSFFRLDVIRCTGFKSKTALCSLRRLAGEKSQQISMSWVMYVHPWTIPAKPPTITKSTLALTRRSSRFKKSLLTFLSLSGVSLQYSVRFDVFWYARQRFCRGCRLAWKHLPRNRLQPGWDLFAGRCSSVSFSFFVLLP